MLKPSIRVLLFCTFTIAQVNAQNLKPAGEGSFSPESVKCIPSLEREKIQAMLDLNIKELILQNKIADPKQADKQRPTGQDFIWPIQNATGLYYNRSYGISNYVDLDPQFPNQLLDWNCGNRTYDLNSGYNHAGVDIFLWPFPQHLQEHSMVEVIAVADGIIIGKEDGNDDKNCSMSSSSQWNAVYVGNTDGTITWYGHLKKNSTTNKMIGDAVVAGEYLGIVGSSGSSTGPHLHFETHFDGQVIDPFTGPCNPGNSFWQNQKPYLDPTLNTIMTHSSNPVFPNCPGLEIINEKNNFVTGDSVFLASYYSDYNNQNPASFNIYGPSNFNINWNYTAPGNYFSAYYTYWYWIINQSWPSGQYIFEVVYENDTLQHEFWVDGPSSIDEIDNNSQNLSIIPNPNSGNFELHLEEMANPVNIEVRDITGRNINQSTINPSSGKINLSIAVPRGIYFIKATDSKGQQRRSSFVIQ